MHGNKWRLSASPLGEVYREEARYRIGVLVRHSLYHMLKQTISLLVVVQVVCEAILSWLFTMECLNAFII